MSLQHGTRIARHNRRDRNNRLPPNNGWSQMLNIPGHPFTRIQDIPSAQFGVADSHFLRTLGIPLIQGRDFAESDSATSPPVALIG